MKKSRIMPETDAPDSTLRFFGPDAFQQEPPLVFSSRLERHAGPGSSVLTYPVGPPKEKDGPRTPSRIKLGWNERDRPVEKGGGKDIHFFIEYTYPAGTDECANTAIGYYKSTDTGGGNTERHPPAKPHEHPATKGGFEGSEWDKDERPGGTNVADMTTGSGGGDKGFIDGPGVGYAAADLPVSRDVRYMIEVRDCHDNVVDCLSWEMHIRIDKDGNVTRREATDPTSC